MRFDRFPATNPYAPRGKPRAFGTGVALWPSSSRSVVDPLCGDLDTVLGQRPAPGTRGLPGATVGSTHWGPENRLPEPTQITAMLTDNSGRPGRTIAEQWLLGWAA